MDTPEQMPANVADDAMPPAKKRKFTNEHQEELDRLMVGLGTPDVRFIEELDALTEPKALMEKAGNYFALPDSPSQIQDVLKVREFLFKLENSKVTISFEQFTVIAPFILNWYFRKSGFLRTAKGRSYAATFYCKLKESSASQDHEKTKVRSATRRNENLCDHSMRLIVNYDGRKVTFKFNKPHKHDQTLLISHYTQFFMRNYAKYLISLGITDTGPIKNSIRTALSRGLEADARDQLLADIGFNNLPRQFIAYYRVKSAKKDDEPPSPSGQGDFLGDMSAAAREVKEQGKMLYQKITLKDKSPSFVIADMHFFKEMVIKKPLILMGITRNVTVFPNTVLITMAYRDHLDCTQVGATALIRSDESTDDIIAFLRAVQTMAMNAFGPWEGEIFKNLHYMLVNEWDHLESAINAVFNDPNSSFRKVEVLFCQRRMQAAFKRKLSQPKGGAIFRLLTEAMHKKTALECEQCILSALRLCDGLPTVIGDYVRLQYQNRGKWASYARCHKLLLMQIKTTKRLDSVYHTWKLSSKRSGPGIGRDDTPQSVVKKLAEFFTSQHRKRKDLVSSGIGREYSLLSVYADAMQLDAPLKSKTVEQLKMALAVFSGHEMKLARQAMRYFKPSNSGSVCVVEGETQSCKFYEIWHLPCRHIFLGALMRGNPAFIDTFHFIEPFREFGFETYEADVTENVFDKYPAGQLEQNKAGLYFKGSQLAKRLQEVIVTALYDRVPPDLPGVRTFLNNFGKAVEMVETGAGIGYGAHAEILLRDELTRTTTPEELQRIAKEAAGQHTAGDDFGEDEDVNEEDVTEQSFDAIIY